MNEKNSDAVYQYQGENAENYYNIVREDSRGDFSGGIDAAVFSYLQEQITRVQGKIVLDVGCGDGRWSEYMAKHDASEIVGIDISEKMIALAETRKNQKRLSNVRFMTMDVRKMLFPDQYFDFALSVFSMMYFSDLDFVLREVSRVLKKDAEMYIATNIFEIDGHLENIRPDDLEVPLELGYDKKMRVTNVMQTHSLYEKSFKTAGFLLQNEEYFAPDGVVIANDYKHKQNIELKKAVFYLIKD